MLVLTVVGLVLLGSCQQVGVEVLVDPGLSGPSRVVCLYLPGWAVQRCQLAWLSSVLEAGVEVL